MKKLSLMFATAALVASGMLATSCSDSDNGTSKGVIVRDVVVDNMKTILVLSNVDAKFTLGDDVKSSTLVNFDFEGTTANIKAEADGYIPQEAKVVFSKDQRVAAVLITLVKISSNLVPQDDAKGKPVTTDDGNQAVTGVIAAIDVPSDIIVSGNTTDPFSFAIFVPAPKVIPIEDAKKGQEEKAAVLGFDCEPDGAQFDKPVTITAVIPGLDGFEIAVPGTKDFVREGDKLSFKVDNCTDYLLEVLTKIGNITKGSAEIYNATLAAKDGSVDVSYNQNSGFEGNVSGYWNAIATSLFGSPSQKVKKSLKVSFEGTGSVNVVIEQAYYDVELISGTQSAKVRVWGSITANAKGMEDQGHSAGSGH